MDKLVLILALLINTTVFVGSLFGALLFSWWWWRRKDSTDVYRCFTFILYGLMVNKGIAVIGGYHILCLNEAVEDALGFHQSLLWAIRSLPITIALIYFLVKMAKRVIHTYKLEKQWQKEDIYDASNSVGGRCTDCEDDSGISSKERS